MPNIDITDDITDVIPDGGTADVTDDSTPDQPIDSDVDDDADREPDDYDQTDAEDMGTGGDPIPPDSTPPAEELPEPVPVARTILQAEFISDYSAANLAEYEQSGAVPYAVYDDGTERQVTWADVSDPTPAPVVIESEAAEVAAATNQHFWQNSTDPTTYGGAGVHVTDDEKDAWVQAVAAGFPDIATKPWHNILINSLGILLRTGLRNLVSITKSAIAFFDGNGNAAANITARFGADGYQVGQDSESHMVGDYHSLRMYDSDDRSYLYISDLRDKAGTVRVTTTADYNNPGPSYPVRLYTPLPIDGLQVYAVYADGELVDTSLYSASTESPFIIELSMNHTWDTDALYTVDYLTNGPLAKAYTLGFRKDGEITGAMSYVVGVYGTATEYGSYSEGIYTTAQGEAGHAEGRNTTAGYESHAEGYGTKAQDTSHAEGGLTQARAGSHAEGWKTKALRRFSHAQNIQTIAASAYQTAIGRANIEDDADQYALIIGNGTLETNGDVQTRSNALAVTWTGIVETVGAKLSGLLEAARAVIKKASGDTSTNALTVNDGTNDVLAVTWNGDVVTPGGSITPVILYDDDNTALNVAITLSESAANFSRLTICYRTNDNDYSSVEVWHPNGKTVSLTASRTSGTTSVGVYLKSKVMKIDGKKIDTIYSTSGDTKYYATSQVRADGNNTATRSNYIAITQVIGYR